MSNQDATHIAQIVGHQINLDELNDQSLRSMFRRHSEKLGDAAAKYQRAHEMFQTTCNLLLADQGLLEPTS